MSYRPDRRDDVPIYAADAADGREQLRADAIARLGATDAREPGTFLPPVSGAPATLAWRRWLAEPFEAWLGMAFIDIYRATGRMALDRVLELDREIDVRLEVAARERSRQAALPWLEGRTEVRRQPQWVKYLRAQETGATPGHLPTIFALQAALFHLPLLPTLTAYVIFEGMNGRAAVDPKSRRDPEAFASRHPEAMETARRVFRSAAEADEAGGWLTSI